MREGERQKVINLLCRRLLQTAPCSVRRNEKQNTKHSAKTFNETIKFKLQTKYHNNLNNNCIYFSSKNKFIKMFAKTTESTGVRQCFYFPHFVDLPAHTQEQIFVSWKIDFVKNRRKFSFQLLKRS